MTHPTFPLYGYERFFAMDPGASAKLAHAATLRGDIPGFLQHLPQAVLQNFNRHPRMRASILPGSSPQKVMICAPLADVSELKNVLTVYECSADEEERAEQERINAAMDNSAVPHLRWMEFVQSECEKPLDREKNFPFYLVVRVDKSTNTFARLILFADHYMSDATSGAVILREILQTVSKLSGSSSEELPKELPLRESLYEGTHYVNAWMNVVHEAVSKYVMQPLMNFDTNAFVPLLPIQTESQLDFAGSPPNPPNQSFALFAQGSEASMRSAMARCKEEHVSLQGAIIAATTMAFGLTKHDGKLCDCTEPLQLRMDVMGDMRPQVALNPVKRGLFDSFMPQTTGRNCEKPVGLYSTPAHLVFTSSEGVDPHGMSFWDVARKADHEWECALLGHELKMQSMFVNEVLNAENRTDSGLCVANCALNDVTLSYLDCSDAASSPFPSELPVGSNTLSVEDLHVYNSHPSLSSTSKLFVTALSHFDYALMYKLEPDTAQKLFGWMVRCTERIGEYPQHDTFAQAADRLAGGAAMPVADDAVSSVSETMEIAVVAVTDDADSSEAGSFQQNVEY
ncbi:hypothetical protein JG687_00012496 [Phytophthora cactorum]|uniref:Condensation domain-containing protein n=1 Tax=Phytophthora cactorum TaxID=29920 RepID=A0A329S3T2_9STRA|nr:hypothetical protein Pcac1_g15174 [Phytophthora cactorum]KAG2805098.1 hypothetical protein PC111_g17971 [Phytophthora cactorum]KAG2810968.1 hypothetical protein PC112_g15823 [Phytophthora cactorum]KAG2851485.1 hypothetical protein PC113_g15873 [Phytophthora cactorum]KAG2889628.1 hypothetical protein PC114_g17874 [Phytophthora cactorum]